jgi:hypothetical protein
LRTLLNGLTRARLARPAELVFPAVPRDREQGQIRAIMDQVKGGDDLRVEVQGDAIVVTKPATKFSVTYQKQPGTPHLVLTKSCLEPSITTPVVSEFRARAFHAAVDRARELGWIV